MDERRKVLFWGLVAAGFLIICLPSTLMLDAFTSYERFLTGFEPSTLRHTLTRAVAHSGQTRREQLQTQLSFVDFRMKAPKAKTVFLVGDFNHWKSGTLALAKVADGSWELTLALPPGRYHYRFLVDGKPQDATGLQEVR